ncbi:hypothetical protein BGW38_006049, partial [Lunasporangiospora selenospora]
MCLLANAENYGSPILVYYVAEHSKRTLQERRIELLQLEEEAKFSQDPLERIYREDLEEIEKYIEQKK